MAHPDFVFYHAVLKQWKQDASCYLCIVAKENKKQFNLLELQSQPDNKG